MSKIENQFAQTLKKSGLKFERNCRDLPGTPDVVFREQKLAVFFHGCFWHSHHCQKEPKSVKKCCMEKGFQKNYAERITNYAERIQKSGKGSKKAVERVLNRTERVPNKF